MTFVHDDPEFAQLVEIVAAKTGVQTSFIEKDYWVTHALWSLQQQQIETWFKGGTSLSKGFDLIHRFSEDLDLKLAHPDLPSVENWESTGTRAVEARKAFLDQLVSMIDVPGTELRELRREPNERTVEIAAEYPLLFSQRAIESFRPFVLLEVGSARVTPFVERPITSWIHQHLEEEGIEEFVDNRCERVRCVHPVVTLLEKLDAISNRFGRALEAFDAPSFARHYEDAHWIIRDFPGLEAEGRSVSSWADEMESEGQIKPLPDPDAACFHLEVAGEKNEMVLRAIADLDSLFWGDRASPEECCATIREFLGGLH